MKQLRLSSCIIGLVLILLSCSSPDYREEILGQWYLPKYSNTYEFLKDGTGSISVTQDGQTFSYAIRYEFEKGNRVVITPENRDSITFKISMPDDDTLVLTSTSPKQTFEMYRK